MNKLIPKFVDGNILTKEMLTALSEFSFSVPDLLYQGYSDGIVSGLTITVENNQIKVTKGVVLLQGQQFLIEQDTYLSYTPSNQVTYVMLTYEGSKDTKGSVKHHYEIALKNEKQAESASEIELCRFKLQKNARLRWRYDDFEDLNTEYDTINLIHSPIASKYQSTLHPEILKRFAREMLSFHLEDTVDIMFCMQIVGSNEAMNVEGILTYISLKAKDEPTMEEDVTTQEEYTSKEEPIIMEHKDIYKKLLGILQAEQRKVKKEKAKKIQEKQVIWID